MEGLTWRVGESPLPKTNSQLPVRRSLGEGGKADLSKTRRGESAVLSRLRPGFGVAGNYQLCEPLVSRRQVFDYP